MALGPHPLCDLGHVLTLDALSLPMGAARWVRALPGPRPLHGRRGCLRAGRFSLPPCGFLTKGGMLAPEMFSPLAIFAKGLNTIVKNRNNEGKRTLLTLSQEDGTGFQRPLAGGDK